MTHNIIFNRTYYILTYTIVLLLQYTYSMRILYSTLVYIMRRKVIDASRRDRCMRAFSYIFSTITYIFGYIHVLRG